MALVAGTNLGPYEILSPLGAGGMGEVYRATDSRLDREVAIKVLPDRLARDPERVLRFEREAKLLASLNHANIAQIYGFDEFGDQKFLVLEYVSGETVAMRLKRGALSVDEALGIGRQIADALEAAHDRGIIHRDLKPGNVMVKADGVVKVLDFGLARALQDDSGSAAMAIDSPTITADYTRPGVVLGTAPYMSPEQARGKSVDKRSDIWSFGVILYECLTGQMLFRGESATDSMGAIMHREPDWSALPASTPASIRRLLRRCLAKDRQQRLRDIGDVRFEIEDAADPKESIESTDPGSRRRWQLLPWMVAALMLAIAAIAMIQTPSTNPSADYPRPRTRHLGLDLPNGTIPLLSKPIAISPDGSRIAWVAESEEGSRITVARLDGFAPTVIQGSEGASILFSSPTGEWLGFFAGKPGEAFSSLYELKKVRVDGGYPVVLCEATLPGSASWGTDGRIYFSDRVSNAVAWVPDSGGTVHRMDTAAMPGTQPPYYVDSLPEGGGLLVSSLNQVFVLGLNGDGSVRVISSGRAEGAIGSLWDAGRARYLPTGHIAYTQRGRLMAAPFDLATHTLLATPTPVVDGVRSSIYQETWDVSADGLLVFTPGGAEFQGELAWADEEGTITPLPFDPAYFGTFRISPNGKLIAVGVLDVKWDVWILDLEREARYRLTTEGDNRYPIWSPDGSRVVFVSDRRGKFELYAQRADGAGEPELLLADVEACPTSFSPDGRHIGYFSKPPNKLSDMFLLSLAEDHEIEPFAHGPTMEWGIMFSPNGKYIAYTSDETGEWRVYVQPYPADGRRWTISTTSFGEEAIWSRDGKTLYYRSHDRWMAVDVQSDEDGSLTIGKERQVLSGDFNNAWGMSYDVAPDGRLLVVRPVGRGPTDRVRVVTNWFEELKRKVPSPSSAPNRAGAAD